MTRLGDRPSVIHYAPGMSTGKTRGGLLYGVLVTHCTLVARIDFGTPDHEERGVTCHACLIAIARGCNDPLHVHLLVVDPHTGRGGVERGGADAAG